MDPPEDLQTVFSLANVMGDLNSDSCVTEEDLEIWNSMFFVFRFQDLNPEYRVIVRTNEGIQGNIDANRDGFNNLEDGIFLENNIGRCYETTPCIQYTDEEERNKCLIISVTKLDVLNEVCYFVNENRRGDSKDLDENLCGQEENKICELITDSISNQNEINLKDLCNNKYKAFGEDVRAYNAGRRGRDRF